MLYKIHLLKIVKNNKYQENGITTNQNIMINIASEITNIIFNLLSNSSEISIASLQF